MEIRSTRDGLLLPELDLWLDPHDSRPAAFVSHAHSDHARGSHGWTLCSPATADLYRLRGGLRGESTVLEWGQPLHYRDATLTLYPAGHILGAAQLLVERGGERFVYTGDLKLDPPLAADPAVVVPCDHLVIESTFGLPMYRLLSADAARRRIVDAARRALDSGRTPVLPGYPLGRSQELVDVLSSAGIPVSAHSRIHRLMPVYRRHTGRPFDAQRWDTTFPTGVAVVSPAGMDRAGWPPRDQLCVIAVSGWSRLSRSRGRDGADVLVPYSDHASFDELIRYVEAARPRRIDVVHGSTRELASVLRARGFDARPLSERMHPSRVQDMPSVKQTGWDFGSKGQGGRP